MQVYGLDKNDLDVVPSPHVEKEQHRLKGARVCAKHDEFWI